MLRTAGWFFVVAGFAFAETQSGVVRSGGQAIPGAAITAICGTDKITTVTDEAGQFELGGLPATPCQFFVSMFGFEPSQRNVTASSSPLTFELKLQTRATLGAEPSVAPPEAPPPQTAGRRGPGRGGFNRGGFGGDPGREGAAAQPGTAQGGTPNAVAGPGRGGQGFRNLNLVPNADNSLTAGEVEPSPSGTPEDAGGSNEAFLLNGSLSQGVQAQPGDAVGLNGPGAFGIGGFGGPGNPFGNPNGPGVANGGLPTLGGAPGGGPGGGGAFVGGGGFGGGGGRGGGGGFGGGGRGGGGRGGRNAVPNRNLQFGNRINRGRRNQFQGSVYYTIGNSVLNARPYSFTSPTTLSGAELPKAGYANNRFGFSGGGPLVIPHLFSGDKTFWFVNYTGVRSKTGFDDVTTVPTPDERSGNFSGLGTTLNYPGIVNNIIPASLLNPAAVALLAYIPLPNAPGLRNNYQVIGANPSNSDNLQTRINQTISAKDGLDVNFNYQHRNSETIQPFGFADPTRGYGLSSGLTYRHTFNRTLINSLVWNFSRNLNDTLSAFSYGPNIEGSLGITGVSPTPAQYGPPTITFTNFGSLTDLRLLRHVCKTRPSTIR